MVASARRFSFHALHFCVALMFGTGGAAAAAEESALVKVGYFNLALVKMVQADLCQSSLSTHAEKTLILDLRASVARLTSEPSDMLRQEVYAKQAGVDQILKARAILDAQILQAVVREVAQDNLLDIVVDRAAIYHGDGKILRDGRDITFEVISLLRRIAAKYPVRTGSAAH